MLPTLTCEALHDTAHAAGMFAGKIWNPTPMAVVQLDANNQPIAGTRELVMDGLCGFAWIKIRPARGNFVKYLQSEGIGDVNTYSGGYDIWVDEFGQSYERKMAYARAYAEILKQYGIQASAQGRLD